MPKSWTSKPARMKKIWEKTGDGRCAHCGNVTYRKTIDHYIPVHDGGTDDQRNLMPLCYKCNQNRSSRRVNPWEYYIYAKPWAIQACLEYEKDWEPNRYSA